jgi:hypothetical protein
MRKVVVVWIALLTVTSVFAGTVALAGVSAGQTAEGQVLHRANAGGTFTADGNTWNPLTDYLVAGGGSTSSHGQPSTIDGSVPAGTPTQIWETERWDEDGGDEMQYEFSVPDGQQVEVRLYFYDGYSGTSAVGDRVFDVSVEDQTVEDFDIIETYGDDTGAMESFTVTSDGTVDVDFAHVTENPQVNAIEVVSTEPQPDTLGGPSDVDFGSVLVGDTETETVTVRNLGGSGDPDVDLSGVSVSGDGAFSAGSASQTTLAPGESADVPVTFAPDDAQAASATLEVSHTGSNSPLDVSLSGEGASSVDPDFTKSKLQGFSAGNPTAIDVGPDGRLYVSVQSGTIYALETERTGENSYQVTNEVVIDAIKDIPNHDDFGTLESGETNRQATGLTAGGTADDPVVYVATSDPEIDVGQDDDDTDTNSGAISRLTFDWNSDGSLASVDHDVMVLGLPRSEENHATNGLDLSADGDTLYVAQGGHTNKGAPGDNFGHTPEYALSAAVLEIDLAQIDADHAEKNLQDYDSNYPDLTFLYAIPTIGNDDATDGDDLPFGGEDGINQAKLVENGPVQIFSPGYRNPYDLVLAESGKLYVSDHGPNGGWGGQPADANGNIVTDASSVTNHPNEDGSFSTNDQLIQADEGEYGGHAAPIRANPTQADIYDANGNVKFDINASNSPVPSSMVNPVEADYIPPTGGSPNPGAPAGSANTMETTSGQKVLFGPTGGTEEYTASNFGGAMQGDILQVELGGDIVRVELSADGETATNVETVFNTGSQPLGIATVGDDGPYPGVVLTANRGSGDVTVFEPVDYGGDGGGGPQCTGADDASIDEDGDGYDNADEIDAGTNPCSSASTPADFDDDGTSNLNDPDDDNDGLDDAEDPFAVDPDNGVDTTLPVQYDFSELGLFGENGQGWTGVMTNGQDDYQSLYDPTKMTVGGAAEVLTVEEVPQGDAYSDTNTQQYGFQFGVDTPDEPFVVETTVSSFPENPENFQSAGLFIGTGDQSNYVKLVAAADGGNGGIEFAKEVDDTFTHPTSPNVVSDGAVAGGTTTLRMTVDPTTDPAPDNGVDEVAVTAEYEVDGTTTEIGTGAMPAGWLDTSDGVAPAVGVIATSNGASPFSATWTDISVDYVTQPANQPPTADAGADVTVEEGQEVTLDASGSTDPDGDALGYTWSQTAGTPDGLLDFFDGEQVTFTAPDVDGDTTLTFAVDVSDGTDTATDTVDVTVEDTDSSTGDQTVAEAVASNDDGDDTISLTEIQQAINWWSTGAEVPNTGGETISLTEIQQLINVWSTGATVGDGTDSVTSAEATVTPNGGIGASTYGGGSFSVTNTGETDLTSVSFDLSESAIPDAVFDPDGTAGDQTAKGLSIDSGESATGVVSTADGDVFSQPHDGDSADGYDVLTVEFTDFNPGETVTFSTDIDPTTIKGASTTGGAGSVSGLELSGSAVTVVSSSATVSNDLFTDGSDGGAQSSATDDIPSAPALGVEGVSLSSTDFPAHQAATVSSASQTLTLSGPAGATVELLTIEASLPPSDGYDLDAYEGDSAEVVSTQTVTLDENGEATVSVSLSESNLNYFQAAVQNGDGDTGEVSGTVVLDYDSDAGSTAQVLHRVNVGGSEIAATDGGPAWSADTSSSVSPYLATSPPDGGTIPGAQPYTVGDVDSSVPSSTPTEVFETERYDPGDSPEMQWTFSENVQSGQTYEVRLYFHDGWSGTGAVGERVFGVNVEGGDQELSSFDPIEAYGDQTGGMESFTVTAGSDDDIDVEFLHGSAENPQVNAIEIVETSSSS